MRILHIKLSHWMVRVLSGCLVFSLGFLPGWLPIRAAPDEFPPFSFVSESSLLPNQLTGDSLISVELGAEDTLVVWHGATLYLVVDGVARSLVTQGEVLPDGQTVNTSDFRVHVVGASRAVLRVRGSFQTPSKFYRWEDGELSTLPKPDNGDFDLDITDGNGRFLAVQGLLDQFGDQTGARYFITDGTNEGASVEIVADGKDRRVVALTADGGILLHEREIPERLYWAGARSGDVLTSNGLNVAHHLMAANAAGDMLVHREVFLNPLHELEVWFYPGAGGGPTLIAEAGANGPYDQFYPNGSTFLTIAAHVTDAGMPVFLARVKNTPQNEYGFFTGADAVSDRFGGSFAQAFGQEGTILDVSQMLGNRATVRAQLADATIVRAFGRSGAPAAINWIKSTGGEWAEAGNWSPAQVPGPGDETLFDLDEVYSVQVGARQSGGSRVEIGEVAFFDAVLTLTRPLAIGGTATLFLPGGSLAAAGLTLGHLPTLNATTGEPARLTVYDGAVVTATFSTVIGESGPGELEIDDASMTSSEVVIGRNAPGSATVRGMEGAWKMLSLAVGANLTGTLTIEQGAIMESDETVVGFGTVTATHRSMVTVDNADVTADAANWVNRGSLTVGDKLPGAILIREGGSVINEGLVQLGTTAHPGYLPPDGQIDVYGTGPNADLPSALQAKEDFLMGMGAGTSAALQVLDGGYARLEKKLHVGHEAGSLGIVVVQGVHGNGARAHLDVGGASVDAECVVGFAGTGRVNVGAGGLWECTNAVLGSTPTGVGEVTVSAAAGGHPAALRAETLCVGGDGLCGTSVAARGTLRVQAGGTVSLTQLLVGAQGRLEGTGTITVTGAPAIMKGTVAPGVNVVSPIAVREAEAALAAPSGLNQTGPGTLTLHGAAVLSDTATLEVDAWGNAPEQRDLLDVRGTLAINEPRLVVNFGNGYAPKQGDTLQVAIATGGVTGSFGEVIITGLVEGFQAEVSVVNGQVVMTALNDGVATTQPTITPIYLPSVAR